MYKNIESLCDERGIKVGRMAVDIGMSKSVLSNLKNGRSETISMRTAQRIAEYLDVSVDLVLRGIDEEKPAAKSDEPSELTEKQEEIRRLLALLPDQEAELILRQIQGLVQGR